MAGMGTVRFAEVGIVHTGGNDSRLSQDLCHFAGEPHVSIECIEVEEECFEGVAWWLPSIGVKGEVLIVPSLLDGVDWELLIEMQIRSFGFHYMLDVAVPQTVMNRSPLIRAAQVLLTHLFHHHYYYLQSTQCTPHQHRLYPVLCQHATIIIPIFRIKYYQYLSTLTPKTTLPMNILYEYMVKGIIDSGIVEDGGPHCYAEIPKTYHIISGATSLLIHFALLNYWAPNLTTPQQQRRGPKCPSLLERIVAGLGIVSLALTFYYKFITGKGMFIFNPCHTALLLTIILLLLPTSDFTCKLHTCWTAWLYGAILALTLPHLYGITQFQVYLYYLEHVLIVPIGPLLLYRRYSFLPPTFANQMASFATMVIYQLGLLLPLSLLTQVNLNFALCHSPADPFYSYTGYHYFTAAVAVLNVLSYLGRWINYLLVLPIKIYGDQTNSKIVAKQIVAMSHVADCKHKEN